MIQLKSINKRYLHEHVLENITCTLPDTGFVSLVGPSGCGKSTLLHIIAGLDHDYSGEVIYEKNKKVSIIFQDFHLIPTMKAIENVAIPLELARDDKAFEKAEKALIEVGLEKRLLHYPSQLSASQAGHEL